MIFNFIGFSIGLVILVLGSFGTLQLLNIPAGSLLDWVIGAASFWWLLVIVTVPWNVHFQSKQVLAEAEVSAEKGTEVDAKQLKYVKLLATRSFWIAIALHLLSAVGLYTLAATGISTVGYISSGAALLLTALRPAVQTYEYLATRLRMIQQEFTYPREDVWELRNRFVNVEASMQRFEDQMNPEQPYSWFASQQRYQEETRKELARLGALLEELRATNEAQHERLSREARNAIAQLSTDGQFLDHVREIIRFFKTA